MLANARIAQDPDGIELRRREPRLDAHVDATLREFGASGVDARLINISSQGFMAETDRPIDHGSRVWLSIPGLPRANALVVWSRGCRLGGEFAEPIDPLDVLHAIGTDAAA